MDLLFVYGTLRSEFDNAYATMLREKAEFVGRCNVRGAIFRIATYPGYRQEPGGMVSGEVYRVDEGTLAALDEYEGPDYERVRIDRFWIYQYKEQPPGNARISSGDFCNPGD